MKIEEIKKKAAEYVDYCSAVPDFNLNSCCKQHDHDYETIGKYTADWHFLVCGWNKAKTYTSPVRSLATLAVIIVYYIGVSIFGWGPYRRAQGEM